MSRIVEVLSEKYPGAVQQSWQDGRRVISVLITKDAVCPMVGFLTQNLEMRFLFLFADDARGQSGCYHIRYVFSYNHQDQFLTLVLNVSDKEKSFPSITPLMPQANWQEREIQDLFGLKAAGHPDPRALVLHEDWPQGKCPLRKDFPVSGKISRIQGSYDFEKVEGDGVFEIPVGPVHAGIIEPGHFRFSSAGESILKLEIRHFYKHKGIEKLGENKSPEHLLCLAERISGDNSVAHAMACAQAMESLAGIEVPRRAQFLRVIYLEMERLYGHLADIAGVVLDVAFSFGSSQLTRARERLMRLNEYLTGSRLLRGCIVFGGVRKDLAPSQVQYLIDETKKIKKDLDEIFHILWSVSSLLDRIQGTGILKKEIVEMLGGTGPVARASGIDRDLRRDHSYAAYEELLFMAPVFSEGDVECRVRVRVQELYESLKLIHESLKAMPEGPCAALTGQLPPLKSGLGYAESPRGECFHWIITDREGGIARWKIQSPSFANWPLIEYAVLENIVPDFPVINKSMNLSYAGNDR